MNILMLKKENCLPQIILNKINIMANITGFIRIKLKIKEFPIINYFLEETNLKNKDFDKIFLLKKKCDNFINQQKIISPFNKDNFPISNNINYNNNQQANNDKQTISNLNQRISQLENELLKEKNKNKILEKQIVELNNKLKLYENSYTQIKGFNSTKSILEKIFIKDEEINELKKKLERYPFELKEGEKLMTVNFRSNDQKLQNYSVICKNTNNFNIIENKLYNDNKEYYDTENYFTCNGIRVHKNKTLDENNIHNNDVIVLNVLDV
jgi:hypothetical protein